MEQKINDFRKIRIMHPKMKQLIVRINALIKDSGENEIITKI